MRCFVLVYCEVYSQLRLEYHHQDGKSHSDSNSIRQAEEECGQEWHNPHALEVENNRMRLNMEEKKRQYNIAPEAFTHAVQFAFFPQVIGIWEL